MLSQEEDQIIPSKYALAAKKADLQMITWTLERSGPLTNGGGWYYQSVKDLINNDGDVFRVLHVLAHDVGVKGVFSDWPATTTYYANSIYDRTGHYVEYNTNTEKQRVPLNGAYQDNLDLLIMLVNIPDASNLHLYPIYFILEIFYDLQTSQKNTCKHYRRISRCRKNNDNQSSTYTTTVSWKSGLFWSMSTAS